MKIYNNRKRSSKVLKGFLLTLMSTLLVIFGCEDVLEKNLKNSSIIVIAPGDSVIIEDESVTFLWEKVEGATSYLLRVVEPSFDSITDIVYDTTLTTNKLVLSFDSGHYEWFVQAMNSAYLSDSSEIRTLIIETADTSTSSSTTPSLLLPVDNEVTNNQRTTFVWDANGNSTFQFFLDSSSINIIDTTLSVNAFTPTIDLSEGVFEWYVEASSNTTAKRTLTVDATPPPQPTALLINGEATASSDLVPPIVLSWTSNDIIPLDSIVYDRLRIYDDGSVVLDTSYISSPFNVVEGLLSPGVLEWEVMSIDHAENDSDFSIRKTFTLLLSPPTQTSPADNTSFFVTDLPINLIWDRQGTDIQNDSLLIYNSDTTIAESLLVSDTTYSVEGFSAGTYLWEVKSNDNSGNTSPSSGMIRFTLQ